MINSQKQYIWENWAKNYFCIAENYFEPKTESEIIEIIKFSGKKIRIVGSGHSFSPIALSNEVLISLKNFRNVLSIGRNSVTCQPGISLKDLYLVLRDNNLSLSNFGVINQQTIAGAIATGTHGSGLTHKSLSGGIINMKLILADGGVMEINKNTEINGLRIWDAASISLGMLGVITEVTLQCEPLFYLKSEEQIISFDEYIQSMDDLAKQFEYFKAWWFPHTDKVYLFKAQRVGEDVYSNRKLYEHYSNEQKKRDSEIDSVTSPMFIKSHLNPETIPNINQDCLNYYFTPRTRIGTSFDILVHDETVPMVVSEYALSIEDGSHKKALIEFHDKIEASNMKLHFPVDLRYTASETSWLSPSYQKDTFQIGICVREYMKKGVPDQMALFFDVMNKHSARPNWGKLFQLSAQEIDRLYPGLNDFKKVKNMFDPTNILSNRYTDEWFGFVRHHDEFSYDQNTK